MANKRNSWSEPIQLMFDADDAPARVYKSWKTPNEVAAPKLQKQMIHL
jgi:hypothetical protein